MISLKDIVPAAQNNINTQFILLDKGRISLDGQHKTCLALVADETAAVHFQLWGDECDAFEPGDIVRLVLLQPQKSCFEGRQAREGGKSGRIHHGVCRDTKHE